MSLNLEETDKILKDLELNNGISLEKISVVFDVDFVDADEFYDDDEAIDDAVDDSINKGATEDH